jgi:hypothetical protein
MKFMFPKKTRLWIKHRNHPQKSISEPFLNVDPKVTEDQARALSNETGLIIVADFNTRSNTKWQTIHGSLVPHQNRQHGDASQPNLKSTASHDFANC